jgi:uncharacterized protein
MTCPAGCNAQLVMSERHGVEIDYCPTCRGVWLDRGELDKILEKAVKGTTVQDLAPPRRPDVEPYGRPAHDRYRDDDDDDDIDPRTGRRRRRGFLDDIFDF